MDNSGEGIVLLGNQLSYIGQESESIPGIIGSKYGKIVTRLDLSYNRLKSMNGIKSFELLEELILDNNQLGDGMEIPVLPKLHTLTLNKNNIVNLEMLVDKISENLPSLTYLSLLGNMACPNELSFTDRDEEDYQRYRYYIINKLPKLKFLDSRQIKKEERQEAQRVGAFMRIVSPTVASVRPGSPVDSDLDGFKYTPLPDEGATSGEHHSTFGKCRYVYYGKHSEGNRFIRNSEL